MSYYDKSMAAAFEAIDFQNKDFFEYLAKIIKIYRESYFNGEAPFGQAVGYGDFGNLVSSIINERFGLNVGILLVGSEGMYEKCYAAHCLYVLTEHSSHTDGHLSKDVDLSLMNLSNFQSRIGSVDLKNARVSGMLSEIPINIVLGKSFLKEDYLTPDEVAAIICHEIGHAFVYMEQLGMVVRTNLIINEVRQTYTNTRDTEVRKTFLTRLGKHEDLNFANIEKMATIDDPDAVGAIVFTSIARKLESTLPAIHRGQSFTETLCDQFSARIGHPVSLARGLDKLHKVYRIDTEEDRETLMDIVLSRLIKGYLIGLFLPSVALIYMTCSFIRVLFRKPHGARIPDYRYDHDRYASLKRELVTGIKLGFYTSADAATVLRDYEEIEKLEKSSKSGTKWNRFMLGFRNGAGAAQTELEIEKLASNPLFIQEFKLNSLTAN